MALNEPKEKNGFSLAFILCSMLMVGVVGLVFVNFHF